jgi:hypothetical protein
LARSTSYKARRITIGRINKWNGKAQRENGGKEVTIKKVERKEKINYFPS